MKKFFTLIAIVIALFISSTSMAQGTGFGHHGRGGYGYGYERRELPRYERFGWARPRFFPPLIVPRPFVPRYEHYRRW